MLPSGLKKLSPSALARFVARTGRAVGLRGKLSVLLTTSAELREMNRYFRNLNKPTDVLSFPALRNRLEQDFAGDIAISAEIAAQQARSLGHRYEDEIRILILHGVLHLADYDHETDGGAMARKDEQLRRKLGLPPGL